MDVSVSTITLKWLDFFNLSKCYNYNIVHTVTYLFGEEAVNDKFHLN